MTLVRRTEQELRDLAEQAGRELEEAPALDVLR